MDHKNVRPLEKTRGLQTAPTDLWRGWPCVCYTSDSVCKILQQKQGFSSSDMVSGGRSRTTKHAFTFKPLTKSISARLSCADFDSILLYTSPALFHPDFYWYCISYFPGQSSSDSLFHATSDKVRANIMGTDGRRARATIGLCRLMGPLANAQWGRG